ncbi:MAG: hypothetical protein ACREL9_13120 [Gemmatimonadales bacterium]
MGLVLLVTLPWAAPRRHTTYVQLLPGGDREAQQLPPFAGATPGGERAPAGGVRSAPPAATPTREVAPESTVAVAPAVPVAPAPAPVSTPTRPTGEPALLYGPLPGDGRLWVNPRPAFPAAVADVLYGDQSRRDSVAVGRLRAMVDSLNQVLDAEQREHRRPAWVTEVAGTKFGIDSQFIHVAGIKIPTAALALLGNLLPAGNYDEAQRAKQLQGMREDILQAARRTQTLQEFRRYVKELRARKQAEREAEKRTRGDTTKAVP